MSDLNSNIHLTSLTLFCLMADKQTYCTSRQKVSPFHSIHHNILYDHNSYSNYLFYPLPYFPLVRSLPIILTLVLIFLHTFFFSLSKVSDRAVIMDKKVQTFILPLSKTCDNDWIKINAGQYALVRVAHSPEMTRTYSTAQFNH